MDDILSIVKIGGNIINDDQKLKEALITFAEMPGKKILVHGGGSLASVMSKRLGLTPKMIDGRRITDKDTLEVVTMVYAGLLNKKIVAQLQSHGNNSIGMSGADGNLIRSIKRPVDDIDYGYAGDIQEVSTTTIQQLLDAGLTPVVCAITHDKQGQLLNTNADTIASALATATSATYKAQLYYIFEKCGVLRDVNDESSIIESINPSIYRKLKSEGSIHSGMIPKLDNCFDALAGGVQQVYIGKINILTEPKAPRTTLSI